jgi:hypothetical protein
MNDLIKFAEKIFNTERERYTESDGSFNIHVLKDPAIDLTQLPDGWIIRDFDEKSWELIILPK